MSVVPERCRAGRDDSRLPKKRPLRHLRASAQVPHRFSQGGGAETGSVVRLPTTPPQTTPSLNVSTSVFISFGPNDQFLSWLWYIYWHSAWEGTSVPSDDLRSYCRHGNCHAALTGLFLPVGFCCQMSLMMTCSISHTLIHAHTHRQWCIKAVRLS